MTKLFQICEVYDLYLQKTNDNSFQLRRKVMLSEQDQNGNCTGTYLLVTFTDHEALKVKKPLEYVDVKLRFDIEADENGPQQVVYGKYLN